MPEPQVLNKNGNFSSSSLEALSYLLIDNNQSAIFETDLKGDVLANPLRFLFQNFSYVGLEEVTNLAGLISHIDPKSEICEVKGVTAYHKEVENELRSDLRKTTTYIPIKVEGVCQPFELKIVRLFEQGTILGVLMLLDEKSYNIEKLYADSYKDQMTGLFNKNALDYHFSKTLGDHYIGFMDLDGFKAFNDKFSHSSGDQILKEVGQKLISIADPNIIFYRVGGDEFGFMTNHVGYEGACAIIKKIQDAISSIRFFDVKLVFSIGFAFTSDSIKEYTIRDALLLADYAMYLSKKTKSDKVHFIDEPTAKDIMAKGNIQDTIEKMSREIKRSSAD